MYPPRGTTDSRPGRRWQEGHPSAGWFLRDPPVLVCSAQISITGSFSLFQKELNRNVGLHCVSIYLYRRHKYISGVRGCPSPGAVEADRAGQAGQAQCGMSHLVRGSKSHCHHASTYTVYIYTYTQFRPHSGAINRDGRRLRWNQLPVLIYLLANK